MSSATATRTVSSNATSLPRWLGWLALTIVIVVVGLVATAFLEGPRVIPRVTVVNPSPYTIELEAAGSDRDGWTLMGATLPKTTANIDDVIDQGSSWVFRVHAQGIDGGEFVVSRDHLAESRWRVTIPPAVIDRLESQRISPSPRIAR